MNDAGVQFGLRANFATQIGRDGDNDIIVGDATVSGHHATVALSNGTFRVHDSNSSNGTLINGKRIVDAPLFDGDLVQFGRVRFIFRNIQLPAVQSLCIACRQPLRPSTFFCSRCGTDQRAGSSARPASPAVVAPSKVKARVQRQSSSRIPGRLRTRKKHPVLRFFGIVTVLFLVALPFAPFLLYLLPSASGTLSTTATPDATSQGGGMIQILFIWNLFVTFPIYGFFLRWGRRILVYLFLRREAYDFADHVIDRAKE